MKNKPKTPTTNKTTILSELKKAKYQHNNVSMNQLHHGKNHSKSLIQGKKQQSQIKSNLEGALKLLQGRLGLPAGECKEKKMSVLGMSQEIYRLVKDHLPEKPAQVNKTTVYSKSQAPTMNSFTNSTNDLHNKKRSQSNHSSNTSTHNVMEYFKEKFSQPADNEEALERKIKLLQGLKRTQEIASRSSSNYNSSMHSAFDISGLGGKEVVVGKIKQKCRVK